MKNGHSNGTQVATPRKQPRQAPPQAAAPERKKSALEDAKQLRDEVKEGLRAVEAKNRFMARVTHELRNTLATIKTAAYCLRDGVAGPLEARQARMVEIISRNVDRQTRMLDNVLDLAHFRSGKFNVRLAPLDVAALVAAVLEDLGSPGAAPQVHAAVENGLPDVQGDADLVAQVLRNLIANALRFAKKEVRLTVSPDGSEGVVFAVTDDGPGVPPDRIRELFSEFGQLGRPAGEGGHKGTGLGLAICKEIVISHNGEIWAQNVPGLGARFSFTLPAA